jgi:hypothetical protein
MYSLTAEQITENWERHLKIVDRFIEEPRKTQLLQMFSSLEDKIILAPASGKAHFHNAIPGGYVDHVNRVVHCALKVKQLWVEMGADIDFTEEELIMSAICHDLGKIGDGDKEGYIPQKDKWRQEKLSEIYTNNTEIPFMLIIDRTLFLLQKYGIQLNFKEYLTIRAHDGVYEEVNKPYFINSSPDAKFKTNLVFILHQADFMAAQIEYGMWKKLSKEVETRPKQGKKEMPTSEGLLNLVKDL